LQLVAVVTFATTAEAPRTGSWCRNSPTAATLASGFGLC